MRRPFAAPLLVPVLLLAAGCALRDAAQVAPASDAPARREAPAGALVGQGAGSGASAALAESEATERARADLGEAVSASIDALAGSLRSAVEALNDPDTLRRFENARHLAASEALRNAERVGVETYLEPDGAYSATAQVGVDSGEPALRLFDELRRVARLDERLAGSSAWIALRDRAALRRVERAGASPLPPVGGARER